MPLDVDPGIDERCRDALGEVFESVGDLGAAAGGQLQVVYLVDADHADVGVEGHAADGFDDVGDVGSGGQRQAEERQVVYGLGWAESTESVGHKKTQLNVQWDSAVIRALVVRPIPWNSFAQAHPNKPTIAADATVRELLYWLGGISDDELGEPSTEADARLWVLARQVRRQGQPAFRAELIEQYGRRCAVTGYNVEEALEAAHIAPYRGPDSNQTSNGLLLRADIHAFFDAHLIGIAEDGTVVWSPLLDGTAYAEELENRKLQPCSAGANRPDPARLQKHLAELRR